MIGHSGKEVSGMKREEKDMQAEALKVSSTEELSFEERLKLLSRSAGALSIQHGQDTDRVCREARGKE